MESENEKDEDKAETEGASDVKVSRVRFGFIICHLLIGQFNFKKCHYEIYVKNNLRLEILARKSEDLFYI